MSVARKASACGIKRARMKIGSLNHEFLSSKGKGYLDWRGTTVEAALVKDASRDLTAS
jgi:hypothetical protein